MSAQQRETTPARAYGVLSDWDGHLAFLASITYSYCVRAGGEVLQSWLQFEFGGPFASGENRLFYVIGP